MPETTSTRSKQFADKMQKIDSAYQRAVNKLAELEKKKLDLVRSYNKKKDDERLAVIRASFK
jgi:hypothetical protein